MKGVMLGPGDSIFPARLSRAFRQRGMHITLVSDVPPADCDAFDDYVRPPRTASSRILESLLLRTRVERLDRRLRETGYRRATGRDRPDFWEWRWVEHFARARDRATAADRVKADFVFAHEATSYGYAASYCRTRPRLLFPWGGDIFSASEATRGGERLVGASLRAADLIVPSSRSAVARIVDRFGIPNDRIIPVSWGADLNLFTRLSPDRAARVRAELGLPAGGPVIVNARRLRDVWGAKDACEAVRRVLEDRPDAVGVLLGGGTPDDYDHAERTLASVRRRVAILTQAVPITRVAEIYSVADVALSLMRAGDMRSSSVVQAAAAGAVPVVVSSPEYVRMRDEGFRAEIVPPDDAEAVASRVHDLLSSPDRLRLMADQNAIWLAEHEDEDLQMDRLASLVSNACRSA